MQRELASGLAADSRMALGDFVLDLARGELFDRHGRPAELRAQALRVLLVLGERAGQVVGKDELLRRVWGDAVVTDDSLVQAIGDIRRLLGAPGNDRLRTVPRRGYLLSPSPAVATAAAQPRVSSEHEAEPAPTAAPPPASASTTQADTRRRGAWAIAGIALVAVLLVLVVPPRPRDAPPPGTLAILPFEPDDPAAADAWLADAITGDLNAMVARWREGPLVIGRGTMQTYRGKGVDPGRSAASWGSRSC